MISQKNKTSIYVAYLVLGEALFVTGNTLDSNEGLGFS
jgi:hypothetical protein